jgi:hypothetical protein
VLSLLGVGSAAVRRHELEHIIRAAAEVTNRYEFVIVGSQSILGAVPNPPAECVMSMEADIFPLGAEELADRIEGAIGEGSRFHDQFGYYAQGVDSTTAILPAGWQDRLVRVQSETTNGRVGFCLDPTDLFLAKCAANRDKDRGFNKALLRHGIVIAGRALERARMMPLPEGRQQKLMTLIRRLEREARSETVAAGAEQRPPRRIR